MEAAREGLSAILNGKFGHVMKEHLPALGVLASCAMALLGAMSLLDIGLSFSIAMTSVAQSSLLLLGGFACFQGERNTDTELLTAHLQLVQNYMGFAMTHVGRGVAYTLALLLCTGVRSTLYKEELDRHSPHSAVFRFLWHSSCLCLLAGCAVSWWFTYKPPQEANFDMMGAMSEASNYNDAYEPMDVPRPMDAYHPPVPSTPAEPFFP